MIEQYAQVRIQGDGEREVWTVAQVTGGRLATLLAGDGRSVVEPLTRLELISAAGANIKERIAALRRKPGEPGAPGETRGWNRAIDTVLSIL